MIAAAPQRGGFNILKKDTIVKKHYLQNAPRGVTALKLDNGDEAIYLDGDFIACCDFADRDAAVIGLGMQLSRVMGVPFQLLTLPVPENEEWCWNEITDELGWGMRIELPRMMLRPVMECCISHITLEDNFLLGELSVSEEESPWILDTDVGYLLRLDAVTRPLLRLKRYGISRAMRALISRAMQQADISMIHFSSVGDEVEGAQVFDW